MKTYVGIDVGKKGAIAAIFPGDIIHVEATPTDKAGEIDEIAFAMILAAMKFSSEDMIVAVEDVHSIFGSSAKSNFQFGVSLGIIKGILSAIHQPYLLVPPKTWQKVAFAGIEKIKLDHKEKGKGTYDNKAMALQAATDLYPKLDLRKNLRCKNAHDGMVDALLIAHWLKSGREV